MHQQHKQLHRPLKRCHDQVSLSIIKIFASLDTPAPQGLSICFPLLNIDFWAVKKFRSGISSID
jgi:hypothetical protein